MSNPLSPQSLVAAYLRDDSGDVHDLSIEQQEAEIRKWCRENQLILNRIPIVKALSGYSTIGRAGYPE